MTISSPTAPAGATASERMSASRINHSIQRIAGSFRDPSGFVFTRGDQIFRAIDDQLLAVIGQLQASGTWNQLIRGGQLVETQVVDQDHLLEEFQSRFPAYRNFLWHRKIDQISFPGEWSFSMLADAGILTLDLQMELLKSGYSLKDATPYNIQFVSGKPVMIDVGSITRPDRLDVWFGLGQFLQMFVYPMLLCRYRGWDLRSYFLPSMNGRDIGQVARSFNWLERLRPGLLLDLTIPWWLHRRAESRSTGGSSRPLPAKPDSSPQAQLLNLQRLKNKLRKLSDGYRLSGIWSRYNQICNYNRSADESKKNIVRTMLRAAHPARVLDIGCNTGDYSFLAAECGADVTSVDGDHDAIESLYRRLAKTPAAIQPMVVDLANPSPAIGYMNVERPSFLERSRPDCVLALALIHHLWVSANMSTEAIRDFLHSLTDRDLILEFVPTHDRMFQRLMNYRVDLFSHITLEHVLQTFSTKFELKQREPIANSDRELLHFVRKS